MVAKICLVYTYYDNPLTLAFHITTINEFSPDIRGSIEVVVVDDGSPESPAHINMPEPKFSLRIFRVSIDKPWNHRAARNIGAHEARAPWLFLLDMDTQVPEATIRALLGMSPENQEWFLFTLRDFENREVVGRHHDTIFMSREFYWRVGGFDENFAGIYGAGPVFSIAIQKFYPWTHLKSLDVYRLPATMLRDASTTQFKRKASGRQRLKIHFVKFATKVGMLKRKALQHPYIQTW